MRTNGGGAPTAAGSARSRPGLTIRKPLIMGTYAFRLSHAEKRRHNDMTHKWTCLLRSPDGEDISYFIKKVVFELDPSFVNPRRTLTSPPYEVSEAGWGEFYLTARIYLVDDSLPPVEMTHFLKLNLPGASQGPCVASETYDELLIHEPADWLYDKITATPISDAPPHPLSPFFIEPNESEERQLQLYLGLQGYVQTESISLMQEAFLLTLRIQELQRQHEAITTGGTAAAATAGAAAGAAASHGEGNEDAPASGATPGLPGGPRAITAPDTAAAAAGRQSATAAFAPSLGAAPPITQTPPGARGPAALPAPAATYGSPKSPHLAPGTEQQQPPHQPKTMQQQQPHLPTAMQCQQQHLLQQHQQQQMVQQQQFLQQQQQQQMLQQQQRQMMQQQQHSLPKQQQHPTSSPQQQQQVLQQQPMGQMPVGPGPL